MNRKTRDKVSDESQIGYLGVKFADLSREAIQMYNMPSGAFVMDVYPGEAADNAESRKVILLPSWMARRFQVRLISTISFSIIQLVKKSKLRWHG